MCEPCLIMAGVSSIGLNKSLLSYFDWPCNIFCEIVPTSSLYDEEQKGPGKKVVIVRRQQFPDNILFHFHPQTVLYCCSLQDTLSRAARVTLKGVFEKASSSHSLSFTLAFLSSISGKK